MPRKSNAAVVSIGIDPGKNTLHLIGLMPEEKSCCARKLARSKIVSRLANVPPCLIGIEVGKMAQLALGADLRMRQNARGYP
jgi:transposase